MSDKFFEIFKTDRSDDPNVKDILSKKAAIILHEAMDGKKIRLEALQAAKICAQGIYPMGNHSPGFTLKISAEEITKALIAAGLKPKMIEGKTG